MTLVSSYLVMIRPASIFRRHSPLFGDHRAAYDGHICFLTAGGTCCPFDRVRDRLHWREQEQRSLDSIDVFFLFSPIPSLFKSSTTQRVPSAVLIGTTLADQTERDRLQMPSRIFTPRPCSLNSRGSQHTRQIKALFMEKKASDKRLS